MAPMYGEYRVVEGGLGFTLEWFDGDRWEWIMDSINRDDCFEAMMKDQRYAHEDRWGTV